jgi:hypothetical protein
MIVTLPTFPPLPVEPDVEKPGQPSPADAYGQENDLPASPRRYSPAPRDVA